MTTQPVFSSSSSSPYDVFLSFRGEDTRTNFTDHLYKALCDKGIYTFIDRELVRGEEISPALVKAIEESRISLIVFSENYASSRWCLDELVKILQCKESKQQIILPFFYKVDPSDVRHQRSSYGDAFVHHERKFKDDKEKVLKWRRALTETANLSGWHYKEGDYEATFINNVVDQIINRVLRRTYWNVAKHPVGIQSHVQDVKKLLDVGGNGRRMVGIWGTSGIGKTTIAKAIWNAIGHEFEGPRGRSLAPVPTLQLRPRGRSLAPVPTLQLRPRGRSLAPNKTHLDTLETQLVLGFIAAIRSRRLKYLEFKTLAQRP